MAQARSISPGLLRAYRQTRYCAAGAVVRIHQHAPAMDALLAQHAARFGVFITAWNPYSRRMPDGWNRRMQRELRQRLRRRIVLPASGGWGRWHEEHLLVLAPLPVVTRLARRFRQNALVWVRPRVPARLHLIEGMRQCSSGQCDCRSSGCCIICSAR